jgi:hypothetical protein
MSTLGKRTSERDDAIAERDRLRQELADMMAEPDQQPDERDQPAEPPAHPDTPAVMTEDEDTDAHDTDESTDEGVPEEPTAAPQPEPDADGYVRTDDGSTVLASAMTNGSLIAPTAPSRTPRGSRPAEGSLAQLRQQFQDEAPGFVAELKERILLRSQD